MVKGLSGRIGEKAAALALVILFSFRAAGAAEDLTSLNSIIDLSYEDNPRILAARARYNASRARIPQASSLDDAKFDFRYDEMTASVDTVTNGMTAPMRVFSWSQEIPFPVKLLLRGQIAAKEAQIAYAELEEAENDVAMQVKEAFAELAWIYKAVDIVSENKIILESLEKTTSARFSLNKVSQQDVLKAQLEIARMNNELIILETKRQVSQGKINILINKDPGGELPRPSMRHDIKMPSGIEELNTAAINNRKSLKAFRLAVERARSMVSLAKQEYMPDFMLKYERMAQDNRLTDWAGMIGVTVPLWFWQKQNFNVIEMSHELKLMESMYRGKENEVLLEVKEYYAELEGSKRLEELYRTAYLPQAEQSLKAALTSYEAAQTDFLNVIESVRMLIDFKLAYYRSVIDFSIAMANLELAVGQDLKSSEGEEK